jgi:hypothetical protein
VRHSLYHYCFMHFARASISLWLTNCKQRLPKCEVPGDRLVPTKRGHDAFKRRAFAARPRTGYARRSTLWLLAAVNLNATLMFLFRRRSFFSFFWHTFPARMDALIFTIFQYFSRINMFIARVSKTISYEKVEDIKPFYSS